MKQLRKQVKQALTCEIELTQGKFAIVDSEDFEKLNEHKWHYLGGYARRRHSPKECWFMHWYIVGKPKNGFETDHINGNTLDNRKCNLRICTARENQQNSKKRKNNTSGYKGVDYKKSHKKWRVLIMANNKRIHLGYFDTPKQAAKAYNNGAKKYYKEFARPNTIV